MEPNELIIGGYYVREERRLIMHFYSAGSDGMARYHAYDLHDGKYRHTRSCALITLMIWTDRRATAEEIGRLHRDHPQKSKQNPEMFERHHSPLREALRRAQD